MAKETLNKELIINVTASDVHIALLENKKLVELHYEVSESGFAVGDIFLAKVKKLMPGLNAAFIDLGYEKDAFLHYTDLSPYIRSILKYTQLAMSNKIDSGIDFSKFEIESEIDKSGKITDILNGKPNIIVQILKEPIASKGPRLSCEISIPGRYVVVTPFNDMVAISKKIRSSDERKRLQRIIESIKPNNVGVIVRTAAEGKNTAELHEDLQNLIDRWKGLGTNIQSAKPPFKILSEVRKTTGILRDLLTKDFNRIIVNDKSTYKEISEYLHRIAPNVQNIVTHYQGTTPVFEQYGILKQVKSSFGKTVNLDSGVYLIIEQTEAMNVIDVNSGYKNISSSQEENALAANLEAAEEISRQLRLRDIGGIIVVDFIDMKNPDNRKKLYEAMEEYMYDDRARHSILPISKFGVMQITRQRMRQEKLIDTSETCPACKGSGKISSTYVLIDDIRHKIRYLASNQHKELLLVVHPILYFYLNKGLFFNSIKRKWAKKYNIKLKLKEEKALGIIEYKFYDSNNEFIRI